MPREVYTCSEFPSHLPSLLHRHPTATTLLLQLSPVTAASDAKQTSHTAQYRLLPAPSQASWADGPTDFITFYAVLLRQTGGEEDGASEGPRFDWSSAAADGAACIENVSLLVGHASHITLQWCALLQHALSVTSLLLTASSCRGDEGADLFSPSFGSEGDGVSCLNSRRYATQGVSRLLVRLAPFVPPLQWDRHVDGVLGSQHFVCTSHRCFLSGKSSADEGDRSEVVGCSGEYERGATRDSSGAAAAAAATGEEEGGHKQLPCEGSSLLQRRRHEQHGCTATVSLPPLPLRIAAVLNGNVPLPQSPLPPNTICVLCLVAHDGCSLTSSSCAASAASSAPITQGSEPNAFDCICDFLADAVMPIVSLAVVGGSWARTPSGELRRDVCKARGKLGNSYAIQLPNRPDSFAEQRARSVTFVVDFSTPLLRELARSAANARSTCDAMVSKERHGISRQIAAAMQEALGQLVSANIDVFSFPPREKGSTAAAAVHDDVSSAAHAAGGSAPLTREVLCRSIAESVSRIVSCSPHPEFKTEVVRLLWGTEVADTSVAVGARAPWSLPSVDVIQRRIERCLLASSSE
ncbi:hypothetical protein ABB37_03205 [Leptomonas pyrrhocoris]|uniref:Uncharacterized protein n=1 Tax=Leptomonas pyrrhocoris TaxID=157538 RepID=A0A0M9G4E2_LEPPY|nr:hypothetical protein ABB37_03205 [Leptomonas pyrrhocoris]KPA82033.1 hypothetical protein ABB37_03205 [Leptomonas pyrrhocoris]|eukprot:XP_015660472.1 hypothetical protein ABB37_03205 [Leptomonas pyrrhocoris]